MPLNAVHLLLEMVADDVARRRTGPEPLRAALRMLTDAVPLTEDAVRGMKSLAHLIDFIVPECPD